MKIAHIINVTEIDESKKVSYLHVAQPLTMKSMVLAKDKATDTVTIELVTVKHKTEEVAISPDFKLATDLETYAWEHIEALRIQATHKPLPRLTDIITSLYEASSAEYFIYTNVDIGLYPDFYIFVKSTIEKGFDGFCINRRELPKKNEGTLLDESNIDLVFATEGAKHGGIDCFVFKRGIVPYLNLGNVYIGYPPVGLLLMTRIKKLSQKFTWFKDEKLTFHIGSDRAWKSSGESYQNNNLGRYWMENVNQAKMVGLHFTAMSKLNTSSE